MARTAITRLVIMEDGVVLSDGVNSLNFVGAGVDVTILGGVASVDITGGGGGGSTTIEVPGGALNDSNRDFTFTAKPKFVVANGMAYRENHGFTWLVNTATLGFAPGSDGDVYGIM